MIEMEGIRMNRVIKFCGKKLDNGEWVWGFYFSTGLNRHYIKSHTDLKDYEVDPETVGQFGNCHDKTGRDIYENHIIKYRKRLFIVTYETWEVVCKPIDGGNMWPHFNQATMNDAEIVGNIFDNPELLIVEGNKDRLVLFEEVS
jgi:hypothetical protein